ncbi:hypothetical protein D9C22_10845 [Bacillus sp. WR11]|uniref:Phage protein n=1 Tax=Bacillus subtilis TaxID=1423 RepID=A0AAP1HAE3_BACIU|nr:MULTISPECIES: hypothetical protein [Bacillus]NMJ92945.1 hypothetical protein [Bacillus sp. WR12]KIN53255.1 hypothetical protein B4146_2179 [Bacillus subtilis]KZD95379.1 phage protein [Bacillus subtilis]MBE1868667.1 hypothetical protein [Bacillus subtilis]MCF7606542.1 hypothetical protein [Bacillus subtilis]
MGRHQAKFEGKIIKKSYGLDALGRFSENEKIEFNCFFEGNIDLEPIEIGGKVFIPGFNEYVVVTDRQRNTNNEWTYQTDKIIKTIEDKESLERAIQEQTKLEEEWQQRVRQENHRIVEQNEVSKKSWWKRLWGFIIADEI